MSSNLDEMGREIPDPTPVAVSVPLRPQRDLIREIIRQELSQAAQESELETFEEADDFYVEDGEDDYSSPYEEFFDPDTGVSNFEREITAGNNTGEAPPVQPASEPPPGGSGVAPAAPAAEVPGTVAT